MLRRSLLITLFVLGSAAVAASAAGQLDVVTSGQDGEHTFCIPPVIQAKNGDLLAFCEGRKTGDGDSGDSGPAQKRSTDGGRAWGPPQPVWNDSDNTGGNPCPVPDEATRTLWLVLTPKIGADDEEWIAARTAQGARTVWVASSKEHGATWTKPVDITAMTKLSEWTWKPTGPGNALQINEGAHAGRRVISCDHNSDDLREKKHRSGSHAIYSADHGQTWNPGAPTRPKVNACPVVERCDGCGTLLMGLRSNHRRNRCAHALSNDGGVTWTTPADGEDRIALFCPASFIRHEQGRLVFSNAAAKRRTQVTVRTSAAVTRTWRQVAWLHTGPSASSRLDAFDAKTVGCLYENGAQHASERIRFARVDVRTS